MVCIQGGLFCSSPKYHSTASQQQSIRVTDEENISLEEEGSIKGGSLEEGSLYSFTGAEHMI